jgi:coproporphyrinogen III oxidase-like Fe-S oxidoreductase
MFVISPYKYNLSHKGTTLLNAIIAGKAKREFARAMTFDDAGKQDLTPGDIRKPRLLYIHIPFCEQLCPYCSFHRVVFDESLCRAYFDALRKEMVFYRTLGYAFGGVYVGGGTPTVLMEELEETLFLAKQSFPLQEISVETNPNHLTEKNMAALKRIGVNRLSVGVQSFDDRLLKHMGRYEKYGSGDVVAERLMQALGHFVTLNADMMFNFPSQNLTVLDRDLDILLKIGVDQITYYPLMVSDSTRNTVNKTFGQIHYGKEEQFYHRIVERLVPPYRFSSAWCFSKKTAMIDEYIVDYDEYAGLGSGSIGYLNGMCYANTFDIAQYIAQVEKDELPVMAYRHFLRRDQLRYDFLMKLFGMKLDVPALRKKYAGVFSRRMWPDILAFFLAGGLRYRNHCFYLTKRGCYMWVIMMREFFIAVNNFRDFCRGQITS